MRTPLSSTFSPQTVSGEQLEALLVGRTRLLSEVEDDLRRTLDSGGARYEALVGPRGLGKSHLLAILRHRLSSDTELRVQTALAWIGEEEHVNSVVALLARVIGATGSWDDGTSAADLVSRLRSAPPSDQEDLAVAMLEGRVGDRSLILMLENLDDHLAALGRRGQQKLRNLLQSHPRWSVVATTCIWSPALANKDAPLYGSFVQRKLTALSAEEGRSMLLRLAEAHGHSKLMRELGTPTGLARIRAIHHVIGGAPRAISLIHPHLASRSLDSIQAAFFDLADELTPHFQEQVRRRPAGQRPLLEALAENWRPLSVGELAERTFNSHQTTSGHLRYLSKDRLVIAITVGRERFYSLAEPLFRIAGSMRQPDRLASEFTRFALSWFEVPGPDALERSAAVRLEEIARFERDRADTMRASIAAQPTGESQVAAQLQFATASVAKTTRPFGRLAPPERALVRALIAAQHGSESPWHTSLPDEPT